LIDGARVETEYDRERRGWKKPANIGSSAGADVIFRTEMVCELINQTTHLMAIPAPCSFSIFNFWLNWGQLNFEEPVNQEEKATRNWTYATMHMCDCVFLIIMGVQLHPSVFWTWRSTHTWSIISKSSQVYEKYKQLTHAIVEFQYGKWGNSIVEFWATYVLVYSIRGNKIYLGGWWYCYKPIISI
jgi:hypothetical protein